MTPVIDSLIILPPTISVASAEPFELRVQVKDTRGYVLPPDYATGTTWAATPAAITVTGTGERAQVKAAGAAGTRGTVTASLDTEGGTKSGSATVTIVDSTSSVADWLSAKSAVKEPPMIALVDGQAGPVTASDSLFAFVRGTQLLPFAAGSGNVVVYARERQVTDAVLPISASCNHLNLKPAARPPPTAGTCAAPSDNAQGDPRTVDVRVFAAPDRAEQVDRDIAYAQRALDDAWTGIRLAATRESASLEGTHLVVRLTEAGACSSDGGEGDVQPQLARMGIPSAGAGDANPAFQPNLITVAYVGDITIAASGITPTGLQCPYDAGRGVIILVDATGYTYSTLAHELGHAFGLGHSDASEMSVAPPFEHSNLMWAAEDDALPVIRGGLTLGQTYRMSRIPSSFVARATPRDCQPDSNVDTPCPRIRRDIRQR